ncbi:MAG: hypothetical protein IKT58_00325 [Oscillospiraceae bacterium]|nr:hypothetical protein [Oscillospiraceae bacterium]
MLRKLLKYDLRAALRLFVPLWIGISVFSVLEFLLLSSGSSENLMTLTGFSFLAYIFSLCAIVCLPTIYFTLRFYQGLLGREGYLMFTLPTQPWKLLTSKLLSALIVASINFLVAIGGFYVWLVVLFSTLESVPLFTAIFGQFSWNWNIISSILQLALSMLVNFLSTNLLIYLACCLGHLFRSRRGLWTILMYFALTTILSKISGTIESLQASPETIDLLTDFYGTIFGSAASSALSTLPLNLGVAILCFFFCERILRNKLNLE